MNKLNEFNENKMQKDYDFFDIIMYKIYLIKFLIFDISPSALL